MKLLYIDRMGEKDELLAVLRTALPDLQRQWPIRALALFGSVARGDANPGSDLDILVELDRPVTLSAFLSLETTLSELTGRQVDLVSRRALKPFIGAHVLREAVPV
jgi:predicted nucleotidyltransferase